MDTRILIALGMLLATAVIALMKGAITGNDVKEVLILVGGGIMGVANNRRPAETAKPAGPLPAPPAGLVLVVVGALLLAGCASTGAPPACNPIMVQCNPADLPPLAAQLPPWPFPSIGGIR